MDVAVLKALDQRQRAILLQLNRVRRRRQVRWLATIAVFSPWI
ncbi:hypothetical protein [Leptolyngbya sp. PCC 6406]|nr:hypothetical protein [Leptolyngbya sp. PCC 6406]